MIEREKVGKLYLPPWRKVKKNKPFVFCPDEKYFGFISFENNIIVDEYYESKSFVRQRIFDKPLTKENYLEACELCRKLFLGEETE